MVTVIPLLKPYEAYSMVDLALPNPYYTIRLTEPMRRSHGLVRAYIHDYMLQTDETGQQYLCIHHDSGDFILYGANLIDVFACFQTIAQLTIFNPVYHQPVTDRKAPIITGMHVKRNYERYPLLKKLDAPTH